jgi:hypothetical protein
LRAATARRGGGRNGRRAQVGNDRRGEGLRHDLLRPLHAAGQVIARVEERYGVTIDRRVIQNYDPETAKGQALGKKRKALFAEVRERFLKELEAFPIANKAVRLHQLQLHYDRTVDGKTPNIRLALEILEKAAKEAGGVHTNETRVHHSGSVAVEEGHRGRDAQQHRRDDRDRAAGRARPAQCDEALSRP